MPRTRATELLGIEHPIVLGGMASGTSPELVAAVSEAGGLGILGVTGHGPSGLTERVEEIRRRTDRPFGLNLLLFLADEEQLAGLLAARPRVTSFAWARPEQDLASYFGRSHDAGALVMHMVSTVEEAARAAEAGADLIVAQGNRGRRPHRPDGNDALALGAEGVLLGTRFLATREAPLPEALRKRSSTATATTLW